MTSGEVTFAGEQGALAGTVWTLRAGDAHPGVVLLQGSGPEDRDCSGYFPPIRDHLMGSGIAVLCYDKPGVGGSTGDWRRQTLRDRAVEALAALRLLQRQDGIDPTRIGLWGHSQGGWVAPLAASLSREVAFVVAVSGPGVSPAEQAVYAVKHGMRADGWLEGEIRQAVAFVGDLVGAARRGTRIEDIDPLLERVRDEAWFGPLPRYFPIPDAALWEFMRRRDAVTGRALVDHDPVGVLERVTCPVLAIFGALDWLLPARESAATIHNALARAGNADHEVIVVPKANHRIEVDGGVAPGCLEMIARWIERREPGPG